MTVTFAFARTLERGHGPKGWEREMKDIPRQGDGVEGPDGEVYDVESVIWSHDGTEVEVRLR